MVYLNVGSRTHGRDTFFCVAKRKYPKKRRPGCRLNPARRNFRRELPEGTSLSLWQRAESIPHPFGFIPPKAPVLGAANGTKNTTPVDAAEHCRREREKPEGWPQEAATRQRDRDIPSAEPRSRRNAQGTAKRQVVGRPFFWLLFFGRAKKSNPTVGSGTHIQINIAKRYKTDYGQLDTMMSAKKVSNSLLSFTRLSSVLGPLSIDISPPWHFNESKGKRLPYEADYGIYLFSKPSYPTWEIPLAENDSEIWYVGKSAGDIGGRTWKHMGLIYEPGTNSPCTPRFKYNQWANVESVDSDIRKPITDGDVVIYVVKVSGSPSLTDTQRYLLPELLEKHVLSMHIHSTGKLLSFNFQL
ncbi:MAG TPA: hypothetical protein VLU73_06615 [Methylococcaceae bacterium]|nr:hypothetical protein [Methylococcaceae bacterium]